MGGYTADAGAEALCGLDNRRLGRGRTPGRGTLRFLTGDLARTVAGAAAALLLVVPEVGAQGAGEDPDQPELVKRFNVAAGALTDAFSTISSDDLGVAATISRFRSSAEEYRTMGYPSYKIDATRAAERLRSKIDQWVKSQGSNSNYRRIAQECLGYHEKCASEGQAIACGMALVTCLGEPLLPPPDSGVRRASSPLLRSGGGVQRRRPGAGRPKASDRRSARRPAETSARSWRPNRTASRFGSTRRSAPR